MSRTRSRVLVYLPAGAMGESLLALHALLRFDGDCAAVVYPGDFPELLAEYLSNPFVEACWSFTPVVFRNCGEAADLVGRGRAWGILVQGSNRRAPGAFDDLAGLMTTPQAPMAYLDVADEAGVYGRFALCRCNYLKASMYRDFSLPRAIKPAPYLHWGLIEAGRPSLDGGGTRPVDVCFLGSATTHPSRTALLRYLEQWSIRHAARLRLSLCISEAGDPYRQTGGHYRDILGKSKICLDLWGHAAQTRRLYEGMSAGCLVLSQSPRWRPCAWTPVPGSHFETFRTAAEMIWKIEFFLDREEERERIAHTGRQWVCRVFDAESIGAWLHRQATGTPEESLPDRMMMEDTP